MELRNQLPSDIEDGLLQAIQHEENARIMYRNAANYCRCYGFIGAHKHFSLEAKDEAEHSHALQHYLSNRGAIYDTPLPDVSMRFTSLRDCFKEAYKAESKLYEYYNDLSLLAHKEKATHLMLNKFIEIQMEAMTNYKIFTDILSTIDDDDLYFWQADMFVKLVECPDNPSL